MQLETLREILTDSTANNWNVVSYGTTYRHHTISAIENAAHDGELSGGEEHTTTASYICDVSLTIAWGMKASGHLSDSHFLVDIFWCGALIDRVTVCSDDCPAGSPVGTSEVAANTDTERYLQRVSELVHELDGKS